MNTGNKILLFGIRRIYVLLILISGFQIEIFAQEKDQPQGQGQLQVNEHSHVQRQLQQFHDQTVDSLKIKQHGFFFGFSLVAYQSLFTQDGLLSVSGLSNLGKPGISATAGIGCTLTDHFGISSGISFLTFNNQVTQKAYQNKFITSDTENETYERRVTATNIVENQNIACLGIPFILNFRIPAGRRFGFSLGAGMEMVFPIVRNYHTDGIFSYKGYYPRYNVILENLPAYGFPEKAGISADGKMELKPFWLNSSFCAGFDGALTKNIQLGIAFHYNRSLTEITSSTSPEKFQLSTDINQISSMMGGCSTVNIQSTGAIVTLRYYLSRIK